MALRVVVAALMVVACGVPGPSAAGDPAGRLRPPEAVTCPRDRLTSYTGRVVSFARDGETLALTIRTDWDTTERVVVVPAVGRPLTDLLLVRGARFRPGDWREIETSGERLRATAWVCGDGRPPVVDWQPASAITGADTERTSRPSARTGPP